MIKMIKNIPGYKIPPLVLLSHKKINNLVNYDEMLILPLELSKVDEIIKKYCKKVV